jgi:hypothetical protein
VGARLAALELELRWVDELAPGPAAAARQRIDAELAALATATADDAERRAVRAARAELAARPPRRASADPA